MFPDMFHDMFRNMFFDMFHAGTAFGIPQQFRPGVSAFPRYML